MSDTGGDVTAHDRDRCATAVQRLDRLQRVVEDLRREAEQRSREDEARAKVLEGLQAQLAETRREVAALQAADRTHEDRLARLASDVSLTRADVGALREDVAGVRSMLGAVHRRAGSHALAGAGVPGVVLVVVEIVRAALMHH